MYSPALPTPDVSNPMVHRDRRLGQARSPWVRSFSCEDMRILIVCRGPIRKEAIDVFREMGAEKVGMLLSERDSIVFPRALAPELRIMDPKCVHPVPDYTGASKEERVERIRQIIQLCRDHDYEYIFAGYGFMAEDAFFVRSIEDAGLKFIGPGSYTQEAAGAKDEAKRTAIRNQVSVTPGIDNATARLLLRKYGGREALARVAKDYGLEVPKLHDPEVPLEELADLMLEASYRKHVDLYTIDELAEHIQREAEDLLRQNPGRRFRLKAIGGGGGKGQRIFADASVVPSMVREVLSEVKATGVGDNKNMLIELNVENTRHNEIQMVGNGQWCVTLGGRDCSLQMHEQKLVEVSITVEGLEQAIAEARARGEHRRAEVLATDLEVLRRMEAEAERFGRAVRLDSASTFECIVEGDRHYFMEVNTRIQVEHRVSELCYALRFTNPEDPNDFFDVHSLVECMALIARHKERLPRPTRIQRDMAAIEARLNATDRALQPAAGGVIVSWSDPIPGEIRDEQGICIKNPDTGLFMRYRIAGAYDSNIALLLATGESRLDSFEKLAEVLRRTTLRGIDLATNREFLYGVVVWFLSRDAWAKPTTKFVLPYLTAVGELAEAARKIDLEFAFERVAQHFTNAYRRTSRELAQSAREVIDLKDTLLKRPIATLFEEPHFLSAWLSQHLSDFEFVGGRFRWLRNPIDVLSDTYHLLHLDDRPDEPAAHRIWDHDQALIERAQRFYGKLRARPGTPQDWPSLDELLRQPKPALGFDSALWARIRAAHAGHQAGMELLALLPTIGWKTRFYDLRLADDLTVLIPERLWDPKHQEEMRKVLVPPPAAAADEIVAAMGGTLYHQEAPGLPPFVEKGSHFEAGQPLYIIEVMKMFNKVYAPFSGTILEVLVPESGVVVRKGQPLFKVKPDEVVESLDPTEEARHRREFTNSCLDLLLV